MTWRHSPFGTVGSAGPATIEFLPEGRICLRARARKPLRSPTRGSKDGPDNEAFDPDAGTWAATLASLQREGFRVVAPDQIGFGKSSKPERYQFSFVQLAANTRALLASLGVERSVVVGHVPQVQAFGAFEKALLEALR